MKSISVILILIVLSIYNSYGQDLTIKESDFVKSLKPGKYILPAEEGWRYEVLYSNSINHCCSSYSAVFSRRNRRRVVLWKQGYRSIVELYCQQYDMVLPAIQVIR